MRGSVSGRSAGLGSVLGGLLVAAAVRGAEACAVCGGGLTAGDPMARGFYWGVLFLMATPFAVAGGFGGWVFYMHWRARHGRRAAPPFEGVRARLRALLGSIARRQKESES